MRVLGFTSICLISSVYAAPENSQLIQSRAQNSHENIRIRVETPRKLDSDGIQLRRDVVELGQQKNISGKAKKSKTN